jgi:TatD DNase family protein
MIDTHAHLDSDQSIKNSFSTGVEKIIDVSRDSKWADKYENVFLTVGYHPYETDEFDLEKLKELAKHPKVVAIGECGLDIKKDNSEEQKTIFKAQLDLARELDLPVAIHCRDMHTECLEMLGGEVKGVIHCFTGSWKSAEAYLKKGMYLSFTGIVTYASDYDKVLKNVPIDRILLETDSPFLAPGKYRGSKSEPWMVRLVAEKIAEVRGVEVDEVFKETTKNAERLFGL